jgi:hypothetical protein
MSFLQSPATHSRNYYKFRSLFRWVFWGSLFVIGCYLYGKYYY